MSSGHLKRLRDPGSLPPGPSSHGPGTSLMLRHPEALLLWQPRAWLGEACPSGLLLLMSESAKPTPKLTHMHNRTTLKWCFLCVTDSQQAIPFKFQKIRIPSLGSRLPNETACLFLGERVCLPARAALCVLSVLNKCIFMFVFADSGQNCSAGSKGERLSARLRAFPATNEPYESSSNKEIGKCSCSLSPHRHSRAGESGEVAETCSWAQNFLRTMASYVTRESVPVHSVLFRIDYETSWCCICLVSFL